MNPSRMGKRANESYGQQLTAQKTAAVGVFACAGLVGLLIVFLFNALSPPSGVFSTKHWC